MEATREIHDLVEKELAVNTRRALDSAEDTDVCATVGSRTANHAALSLFQTQTLKKNFDNVRTVLCMKINLCNQIQWAHTRQYQDSTHIWASRCVRMMADVKKGLQIPPARSLHAARWSALSSVLKFVFRILSCYV